MQTQLCRESGCPNTHIEWTLPACMHYRVHYRHACMHMHYRVHYKMDQYYADGV